MNDQDDLQRIIDRAAYFNLMVVPRRTGAAVSDGTEGSLVRADALGYRFEIDVAAPLSADRVRVANAVSGPAADVRFLLQPVPDDFQAAPGRRPPPTALDPGRVQRFVMPDTELRFNGRDRIRGFAAGRTYPDAPGRGSFRIAAVGVVLEGTGRFAGHAGIYVLCGEMKPPGDYVLNVLLRVTDLDGTLLTEAAPPPLEPVADPEPTTTYVDFHSLVDPDSETRLLPGPGGGPGGLRAHERLTFVDSGFGRFPGHGLRSNTTLGEAIGELGVTAHFYPPGPTAGSIDVPIAFDTVDSVFTFHDRGGRTVGSVTAGVEEGRAFLTPIPGTSKELAPQIFGGFGPFTGASGVFAGAEGMMYTVGLGTVRPHLTSNIYIFRIADPAGRLRVAKGASR